MLIQVNKLFKGKKRKDLLTMINTIYRVTKYYKDISFKEIF